MHAPSLQALLISRVWIDDGLEQHPTSVFVWRPCIPRYSVARIVAGEEQMHLRQKLPGASSPAAPSGDIGRGQHEDVVPNEVIPDEHSSTPAGGLDTAAGFKKEKGTGQPPLASATNAKPVRASTHNILSLCEVTWLAQVPQQVV